MTTKPKKVAAIPRGFRSITPHVTTSDVRAAISLYETALGATLASSETAPGTDTVVFALVKIGNSQLTIGQGEAFGPGFVSLHHYVEDIDATWDAALSAGFAEVRAVEETYWGDRMGLLIDPLGVHWSVAQRVLRLTAEERDARARTAAGLQTPDQPVAETADLAEVATIPAEPVMEEAVAAAPEAQH